MDVYEEFSEETVCKICNQVSKIRVVHRRKIRLRVHGGKAITLFYNLQCVYVCMSQISAGSLGREERRAEKQ